MTEEITVYWSSLSQVPKVLDQCPRHQSGHVGFRSKLMSQEKEGYISKKNSIFFFLRLTLADCTFPQLIILLIIKFLRKVHVEFKFFPF